VTCGSRGALSCAVFRRRAFLIGVGIAALGRLCRGQAGDLRLTESGDQTKLITVKLVNIHEAKTHLSRLIQEAMEGEEIVIARGNVPLVRLVLVESARPRRSLGWAKGQVTMAPDFDGPLDDFADYQ